MQHPASSAEPADYLNVSGHHCAQCGGSLTRTPERPIDHFWNLLVPVQRFRCGRFSCQWTGNLRVDAERPGPARPSSEIDHPHHQ